MPIIIKETRTDEFKTGWTDTVRCEAELDCSGSTKYMEAVWSSDSADYLTIEVHDTSVHDILDDPDALAKARETGTVFKNYEEAVQSEYRSAVELLSQLISDRLAEKKALDTYKENDGLYSYPAWYSPTGSFIDSDDDDDNDVF